MCPDGLGNNEPYWAGHVACVREQINAYRVLVRKPEGKRPRGKPRHRWAVSIKIEVSCVCWEGVDWIRLDEDNWGGCCEHGNELPVSIKCGYFLDQLRNH